MSPTVRPTYSAEEYPFARNLKQLLEETGTTQPKLASYVGITKQAISLYVTGKSAPDIYTMRKIAEFFGVSSDWLIGLSSFRKTENQELAAADIGLSEAALVALREYPKEALATASLMIEHGYLLFKHMDEYLRVDDSTTYTIKAINKKNKEIPVGYSVDAAKLYRSAILAMIESSLALAKKDWPKHIDK